MELLSLGLSEQRMNPLESPSVPLSSPVGWHWLEGSRQNDAGELVSPHTAMATATVYACVKLLSQSIASMSPILYRREGSNRREATDNPLHRILSLEPNDECSAFSFWESFTTSLLLWGNGYAELQFNGVGQVVAMYHLRPDQTTPFRQDDGTLAYRTSQGMKAGFRVLPARSVLHVPWGGDCIVGASPIQIARNAIGGAIAQERFANRFFANYAVPTMALLSKKLVKAEDRQKMRRDWESLHSGSNQHRLAVLDGELDLKVLGLPPEDAQLLESRRFSREEICGLYGLKPSQIGSEARVAGETYAAQQLDYLTNTLAPILSKYRQALTRSLLRGLPQYEIQHDVSDRLRLDIKSQMDAFAVARQWGLMTSNQCRLQLGMDPGGPECDEFWRPVNMVNAAVSPAPANQTEGIENV